MSGVGNPGISGAAAIAGAAPVKQMFTVDFTATFGAIAALVGAVKTRTITGLLTTDTVLLQCRGSMTAGATIANARVSADDTLEIAFTTAVALGVTLGPLTYRCVVLR